MRWIYCIVLKMMVSFVQNQFHLFVWLPFNRQVGLEFSVPFISIPVKRSVDTVKSWASQTTAFVSVCIFKKKWFASVIALMKRQIPFFKLQGSHVEHKHWSCCFNWCGTFRRIGNHIFVEISNERSNTICQRSFLLSI